MTIRFGWAVSAGLLGMLGCGPARMAERPAILSPDGAPGDGAAVLISFQRQNALWVTVRTTAVSRVLGWTSGSTRPVLVLYATRGFNPAFTGGAQVRVAWMDGDKVVAVAAAAGADHLSPPQEVTAAILLPPETPSVIQAGDHLRLVEPS